LDTNFSIIERGNINCLLRLMQLRIDKKSRTFGSGRFLINENERV